MTTTDDLDHWSLHKLEMVMGATQDANQSLKKLGDTLDGSRSSLWNWGGEAADTWRAQHGKIRTDIDAQGHQSQKVHDELAKVYPEVKAVKDDYDNFRQSAASSGLTVSSPGVVSSDDPNRKADVEAAQTKLNAILQRATKVDEELADAIKTATGPQAPQQTPTPTPDPAPQTPPDQPTTGDNHVHDYGSQERPGVTDVNDPNLKWQPGFDPQKWKGSWHNPQLADNPPGYNGPAGPQRDQAWQDYLAHFPTNERGFLPNPDAVSDRGLKVLGSAGTQLGTSYAWGGKGLNGPGKGTLEFDPPDGGAHE